MTTEHAAMKAYMTRPMNNPELAAEVDGHATDLMVYANIIAKDRAHAHKLLVEAGMSESEAAEAMSDAIESPAFASWANANLRTIAAPSE